MRQVSLCCEKPRSRIRENWHTFYNNNIGNTGIAQSNCCQGEIPTHQSATFGCEWTEVFGTKFLVIINISTSW